MEHFARNKNKWEQSIPDDIGFQPYLLILMGTAQYNVSRGRLRKDSCVAVTQKLSSEMGVMRFQTG